MDNHQFIIYGLFDPITDELRYIGKTNDIVKRRSGHLRDKSKTYKANWIRSLLALGLKPEMRTIAGPFADELEALLEESRLIVAHLEAGDRLTNLATCTAPSGMCGKKHSEETRKKMSDSRRGEKHWAYGKKGPEHPAYGCVHSDESRKKVSDALTGIVRPREAKEKNRQAQIRRFAENGHPRSVSVCLLDPNTGEILATYIDSVQAGRALGVSSGTVRNTCDQLTTSEKAGMLRYYDPATHSALTENPKRKFRKPIPAID